VADLSPYKRKGTEVDHECSLFIAPTARTRPRPEDHLGKLTQTFAPVGHLGSTSGHKTGTHDAIGFARNA
jgi:hypothetical protein